MQINLIFPQEQKALDQLRMNHLFFVISQEPLLKKMIIEDLEEVAKTNFIFVYKIPQVPFEIAHRQLQEIMNTF